jgi:hypothetical protein
MRCAVLLFACLAAGTVAQAQRGLSGGGTAPARSHEGGIAVVELFTSQGCSSCPPADRLLAEIIKGAGTRNIFGLSFHVDYWNKLGWHDPYSRLAFTRRQNNYVSVLKGREVYTPQVFVNGRVSMVGSDRDKLYAAIDSALATPPKVTLDLRRDSLLRDTLFLGYTASAADKNYSLVVALVESGVETRVNKGENAGKTLRHEHVVRIFRIQRLRQPAGTMPLPLEGLPPGPRFSVIAYVQQIQSKHILGATSLPL